VELNLSNSNPYLLNYYSTSGVRSPNKPVQNIVSKKSKKTQNVNLCASTSAKQKPRDTRKLSKSPQTRMWRAVVPVFNACLTDHPHIFIYNRLR